MTVPFDQKVFQCDHNIAGSRLLMLKPFFSPSTIARRSYLYLQGLASIRYSGDYYTKRSGLDSYLLAHTFAGEGELEYEGKSYTLKADDGFIIDCRKPHYYHTTSPKGWAYHIAHFDGFAMHDYFSQIKHGGGVVFSFPPTYPFCALLEQLFKVNAEVSKQSEMQTSRLLTDMLTEIMLNMPGFDTGEEPEWAKDIRDYLNEHFAESVSLDELSSKFAISKYHLCREFKRYIGKSPKEYLIAARITNAKALLHGTNMRVADIAQSVGFSDYSNFFAIFRKYERLSPVEYRRQWIGSN
jgi:AraC-like DNA-binding protein